MENEISIDCCPGNYYGGLFVKKENGKFFWGIENWDEEVSYREISESLYKAILKEDGK